MPAISILVFFSFFALSATGETADQASGRTAVNRTAQPYDEVEYVYGTSPDFFSERAGSWQTAEDEADNPAKIESTYQSLDQIVGVQARDQGAPAISIRGSGAAGRVLTLYNGIPLNSGDGFGAPDLLVPKEVIERTFLIKGPSSTFYGASAMAGAVNHLSQFQPRTKMELQGSSANTGGVLLGVPLVKNKGNRIQSSVFLEGGPRNFYFQNPQTDTVDLREENQRFLQRLTLSGWQDSKTWEVREDLILAHDQGTTPGPVHEPQVTDFENWAGLASLSIKRKFTGQWSILSRSAGQATDSDFDDRDNDLPDSSLLSGKFAQSLSVKKEFTDGASFETFGDYTFHQLDSDIYPEVLFESRSDIGGIAILPLGNFVLQSGLRYLIEDRIYAPSVGLTYLWETVKSWITYSEGYRPPSLSDRFAEFPTFTGNPDLLPERSRQIELGLGSHLPQGFQWNLTGFATEYSDFIQFVSLDEQNSTMRNIGSARVFGGEAAAGWRYRSWQLLAASALTATENADTGEELLLTPTVESSLTAAKQFRKVAFSGKLTYWGESFDENQGERVILDDGLGLDFAVEFKLNQWQVSAALLNSLDQPREMKFGFPQPQRRLVGKLTRFF